MPTAYNASHCLASSRVRAVRCPVRAFSFLAWSTWEEASYDACPPSPATFKVAHRHGLCGLDPAGLGRQRVSAAQGRQHHLSRLPSTPGLSVPLASGETLPLTVDPNVYHSSVHATDLTCTSCHTNISGYPHPKLTAGDRRSFQLERYQQCKTCHQDQYMQSLDSNHARELAAGNRNAAICTDCHGSHDVTKPDQPRTKISSTCQKCHSAVYDQYAGSVHGSALLEAATPTCPSAPTATAHTPRKTRLRPLSA